MKVKIMLFIMLLTFFSPNIIATSLSFGPGYYNFSGDIKEIYNGSNVFYTAELSFKLKIMELFVDANINSFNGQLSFTKDKTTLNLNQIELGILFPFGKKILPYIGTGSDITFYKESNSIGKASGTGFGFFGAGGIKFKFGKMFLDLRAKYTMLKIKGVDLSGISAVLLFGVNL